MPYLPGVYVLSPGLILPSVSRLTKSLMKQAGRLLLVTVLLALSSSITPQATGAGSSLIAHWRFDEGAGTTAADSSGNNRTGTLVNGPQWVAGQVGAGALSFDGLDDYVVTADIPKPTDLTLSAWIYPTATTNTVDRIILNKHNDEYDLRLVQGAGGALRGMAGGVGLTYTGFNFTSATNSNKWYHVAYTFKDADNIHKLYVNGVLVASGANTSSIVNTTNPLWIGRHSQFNFGSFNGKIDDVRVYDRALSAEAIADLFSPSAEDVTPPAISLTSPASSATVSSTITVTAEASDDVGVAGVQFFVDGNPIGIEDTIGPYSTSWNTTSITNGSHTLSAQVTDESGNTASSAVTLTVSNAPLSTDPAVVGRWSPLFSMPLVAVHTLLMHTGEVLMWDDATGAATWTWNPNSGVFFQAGSPDLHFCGGLVTLADGRAFVVGGGETRAEAIADAAFFDPETRTWASAASMTVERWYPTATTLRDGRVLVNSGAWRCGLGECLFPTPEIYDPATNVWTRLPSATLEMPLYPFIFQLPNGRVAYAGSDEANTGTYALNMESRTWSMADPVVVPGGSAVMYRPGLILKAGTPGDTHSISTPAVETAFAIDMNQQTSQWRQVGSMAFPRAYHTLTSLADGNVLATSGLKVTDESADETQGVLPAEIWDAATERWSTMASMQVPRSYHSTALLLPDGRVLIAGSGRLPGVTDQLTGEIFSPPYLFRGPRPVITSVPKTVQYNSAVFVQTPDAASIASVGLVRPGAVTHAYDQNQRYVPASFTRTQGGLTVQMPPDGNSAPPGYYMLFIVNSAGVPSVASFVRFPGPNEDFSPPTIAVTSPAANATVSGTITVTADAWDNFGVAGVQFFVDGDPIGVEDTLAPYEASLNTDFIAKRGHALSATARDAAGNTGSAAISIVVSEPDTKPPLILNVMSVDITSNAVNVNWVTDEAADSQVQFLGACPSGGCLTPLATTLTTSHTVSISGFAPAAYRFRVISRDAAGNVAVSGVHHSDRRRRPLARVSHAPGSNH